MQDEKQQDQETINSLKKEVSYLKHSLEEQDVKTKKYKEEAELYAHEIHKLQEMSIQEKKKTHEAEGRTRCAEEKAEWYQKEVERQREEN